MKFSKKMFFLILAAYLIPFTCSAMDNPDDNSKINQIKSFIAANFDITMSTCSLQEADIICFSEKHDRPEHRKNMSMIINMLAHQNSVFLIEGLEKGSSISQTDYNKRANSNIEANIPIKGWDDTAENINKLMKQILDNAQASSKIFKAYRTGAPLPDWDGQALSDYDTLIKRNRIMMTAIDEEISHKKQTFVLFGRDHFFNEEHGNELRTFLATKKCYVLTPKDQERSYSVAIRQAQKYFGNRLKLEYSQWDVHQPYIYCLRTKSNDDYRNLALIIKETQGRHLAIINSLLQEPSIEPLLPAIKESDLESITIMNSNINENTIIALINNASNTMNKLIINGNGKFHQSGLIDLFAYAKRKNIELIIKE